MGGWRDGWAVCEVWVDRWVEGEGNGEYRGRYLWSKKKKWKITLSFTSPEKEFFFIYDVIVKQKKDKRAANHY